MARASTRTLLPLDTWAKILGIDMWSFNQFDSPTTNAHQCADVWYQWQWQRDFLSREELASAVAEAEAAIAEFAGFWPAPQYIVDEALRYPRHHDMRVYGLGRTVRGFVKPVQLRWGKIQSGGQLNRVVLDGSPAAPVFSDTDGDGVEDRFTVTIATDYNTGAAAVTDPAEIALYFTATDRNNDELSETWRIRPVHVSIAAGTATITGHKSLLVKPDLQSVVNPEPLNPAEAGNFVTSLEVYRTYIDTSYTSALPYQGVAIWDVPPDCAADCSEQVLPLCLGRWDMEGGWTYPTWGGASTWPYQRQPDRLQVNYVAGERADAQGYMNDHMARIVTYLAVALLPKEKCGCERSQRLLHYWRSKPNENTDNDRGRAFTAEEINTNPFVERNGALWAWKRIRFVQQLGGVAL